MNKLILSAVIASAFLSSAAFAADPATITVNGGQVKFTGSIVDGACSIVVNDNKPAVELAAVKAGLFTAAKQNGNAKTAFDITLADCVTSTYKNASITFSGQSDATDATVLANNAGVGSAQGVAIQLFGEDGKALSLKTASAPKVLDSTTNTMHFSADYISTAAAVTSGSVASTADFQITYN